MFVKYLRFILCVTLVCTSSLIGANEVDLENNSPLLELAKENLVKGTLKQTDQGFVYIDIEDSIVFQLFSLINDDNYLVELPDYFGGAGLVGAHISVISAKEIEGGNIQLIEELGQEFSFEILYFGSVVPHQTSKYERVWILGVFTPELDDLRLKYHLPSKIMDNDFHVTLAVATHTSFLEKYILKNMSPDVPVTLDEVQELVTEEGLQYSRDEIKNAFSLLIQKGFVVKNGHGKSTTYLLNDPTQKPSFEEAYSLLLPESELEDEVITSEEWILGATWGEPRPGHPEGAIIHHVLEVLNNVDRYYFDSQYREKLRLIALIHDTFKYKVDRDSPKVGENHHAMIARRFAEKYIHDEAVLDVIQLHDDAYNAWAKGAKYGDWNKAYQRAEQLIQKLGDNLDLYMAFYECDIKTGDKKLEPLEWFKNIIYLQKFSINSIEALSR